MGFLSGGGVGVEEEEARDASVVVVVFIKRSVHEMTVVRLVSGEERSLRYSKSAAQGSVGEGEVMREESYR